MSSVSVVSQTNNSVTIDAGTRQQQVQQSASNVELKNGATLKGTVMSVESTENGKIATINIGEGTISAKLTDGMGLREGQVLSFAVRSTSQNGATITPLLENTSIDQSTLKALTAAGLEINQDTVAMVKEMMEANLSISKDSLLEMNRNLVANPNTSISTLVEMKSLNIPITENNIEQFGNYKNYEHQVITEMQDIINELPEAFNELASSGNVNSAVQLYGNVLKMFTESMTNPAAGEMAEEAVVMEEGVLAQGAETVENGEPAVNAGTAETAETAKGGLITNADGKNEIAGSLANGEVSGETVNGNIAKNPDIQNQKGAIDILSDKGLNDSAPSEKIAFADSFIDNLKNVGLSDKTVDNLLDLAKNGNAKEAQELLFKELAASYDKADFSSSVEIASWKKLFSSDDYNKALKNTISEQWLLKPDDVQKKENIEQLYQRLGNQAKALSDAVNNSALQGSKLGQAATNLSNNLDFMNQLNHMFQYIQLPLQMTGQNVHGDLYVYRNKYKKMSEDGSVSAALHLDMENLGPVDVYVKMIDTKVTTNFYVADDSVMELIDENIHILQERLEKRGYSMQVNLKLHDEEDGSDSAVDEMLSVSKMPILSTNSFDARA